jgi:hypothetical protein
MVEIAALFGSFQLPSHSLTISGLNLVGSQAVNSATKSLTVTVAINRWQVITTSSPPRVFLDEHALLTTSSLDIVATHQAFLALNSRAIDHSPLRLSATASHST